MNELDYRQCALTAIDSLIKNCYNEHYDLSGNVVSGDFWGNYFWERAEMIELFEDFYDIIGDEKYRTQAELLFNHIISVFGEDWTTIPHNDDTAWASIAAFRLYEMTRNKKYLEIGKNSLDMIWKRGRGKAGGLMWKWDDNDDTANSITMSTFSVAACMLGRILNDDSYYKKAISQINYMIEHLVDTETGAVWDKQIGDTIEKITFSYNSAMFARACLLIYEYNNEQKYLEYADLAVQYYLSCNDEGHLGTLDINSDGEGFDGILARQFGWYARHYNHPEVVEFLRANARGIWEHRNSFDLTWANMWVQTPDSGDIRPWSYSSTISILLNSI